MNVFNVKILILILFQNHVYKLIIRLVIVKFTKKMKILVVKYVIMVILYKIIYVFHVIILFVLIVKMILMFVKVVLDKEN